MQPGEAYLEIGSSQIAIVGLRLSVFMNAFIGRTSHGQALEQMRKLRILYALAATTTSR
jgi:hypothetical protein